MGGGRLAFRYLPETVTVGVGVLLCWGSGGLGCLVLVV